MESGPNSPPICSFLGFPHRPIFTGTLRRLRTRANLRRPRIALPQRQGLPHHLDKSPRVLGVGGRWFAEQHIEDGMPETRFGVASDFHFAKAPDRFSFTPQLAWPSPNQTLRKYALSPLTPQLAEPRSILIYASEVRSPRRQRTVQICHGPQSLLSSMHFGCATHRPQSRS